MSECIFCDGPCACDVPSNKSLKPVRVKAKLERPIETVSMPWEPDAVQMKSGLVTSEVDPILAYAVQNLASGGLISLEEINNYPAEMSYSFSRDNRLRLWRERRASKHR